MRLWLKHSLIQETFDLVRCCGAGSRECQVLWVGDWARPGEIQRVVHPRHRAHSGGFEIDELWLNEFWVDLSRTRSGIWAQIHTHPSEAFHSAVDDAFPIVHSSGFLSLVIPRFGLGSIGFDGAYLTELQADGTWKEIRVGARIEVIP